MFREKGVKSIETVRVNLVADEEVSVKLGDIFEKIKEAKYFAIIYQPSFNKSVVVFGKTSTVIDDLSGKYISMNEEKQVMFDSSEGDTQKKFRMIPLSTETISQVLTKANFSHIDQGGDVEYPEVISKNNKGAVVIKTNSALGKFISDNNPNVDSDSDSLSITTQTYFQIKQSFKKALETKKNETLKKDTKKDTKNINAKKNYKKVDGQTELKVTETFLSGDSPTSGTLKLKLY